MSALATPPATKAGSTSHNLIAIETDSIEAAAEVLLDHATALGASDLFICTNEQHVLVQVRHLGMVRPLTVMSTEQGKRVLTLIKTRALLDLAERRRPQEGRWIYQNNKTSSTVDLRVSAIPTAFGEDLAIRILDRTTRLFSLENPGHP